MADESVIKTSMIRGTAAVVIAIVVPLTAWCFTSIVDLRTRIGVWQVEKDIQDERVRLMESQISTLQDHLQKVELRQLQALQDYRYFIEGVDPKKLFPRE